MARGLKTHLVTSKSVQYCQKPLLLVLILLATFQVRAQDQPVAGAEKSTYGLKAGINFAELWGDDALPESDRKVGYSVGAYASFKLSKDLKI